MSWNGSIPILGIACLMVAGCASPKANGSGNGTTSQSNQASAPVRKAAEVVLPYPEGYCDDLPAETSTTDKPDDTRIVQTTVRDKDGTLILHGLTEHFWKNNAKKLVVHFRCGLKHGPKNAFFPDGEPWNEGAYINGQGHGIWREWHTNGIMSQEFTLDHGAWNGVQTGWHPTGEKRLQVQWVNGDRQGIMRVWDEEGTLRRIIEFVDGEIQPAPLALFSVIDAE